MDHVPARIFLDEPYAEEMRVVDACRDCNSGSSGDEQYLACLLECVVCGSTVSEELQREKVRRTLAHSPALAQRIGRGSTRDLGPHGAARVPRVRGPVVMVPLISGWCARRNLNLRPVG